MADLCIAIGEPLVIRMLDAKGDVVRIGKDIYRVRATPDPNPVFYDWIIDDAHVVGGLEIHLAPDHPLLQSRVPLRLISSIEASNIVRIWLGASRRGIAQGKEAFDDIRFCGTNDNKLAIVVGLESWLTEAERDSVLQYVTPH